MISNIQNVWDSPFELLRDVDRAFQSRGVLGSEGPSAKYPVDIHEDEDGLTVSAELPGFRKDQVQVSIDKGILSIAAERQSSKKDDGTTHLFERRFPRVHRQFTLPTSVDTTDVDAKLADGLLTLRLRKKEEVKRRKIEVK